jgi:hypothetical protein
MTITIPTPPSTVPPARWLAIARAAGVAVTLLAVTFFLIGLPTFYDEYRTLSIYDVGDRNEAYANLAQLGLSVDFYAGYNVALGIAFMAACLALATLIFVRKSDEPIALFRRANARVARDFFRAPLPSRRSSTRS